MKILVFYTPRSKSTMIGKVLAKKFGINYCESPLTLSRLANKNFDEYPELINKINALSSGCIKICANDFVNLHQKTINEDYKKINFNSFDYVIFLTRENMLDAVLSFGYMDSSNRDSWHRRIGETKEVKPYSISPARIFNLLRGYTIFNIVKKYIAEHTTATTCECDYNTVNEQLITKFDLQQSDFDIDLVPNDIPYKTIVTNYNEISMHVKEYAAHMTLPDADFNNPTSFFWTN